MRVRPAPEGPGPMKGTRNMPLRCLLLLGALSAALASPLYAEDSEPSAEGRKFFLENVLPRLGENGCPSCHAVGYMRPNVTRYEELLRRLAIGDSADSSVVIYKLANLRSFAPDRPTHPGGQRCATPDSEPCKTLKRWWEIEFGDRNPDTVQEAGEDE